MIPTPLDRAFPALYQRSGWAPAAWLAIGGLWVFAGSVLLSRDLSNLGLNLFLVGSFLSTPAIYRGDPDARWYLLVLLCAAWMLTVNTFFAAGAEDLTHWKHSREHLKIFLFLLCGWWLGGAERSVWTLILVGVGGVLAVVIAHGSSDWSLLGEGARLKFGFRNQQHSAAIFATVLLGVLCFARRAFSTEARSKSSRWLRIVLWTGLLASSLVVIITSQTRQVWLGLVVAGTVILWLKLQSGVGRRIRRRVSLALIASVLLVGTALPILMPATLDAIWSRSATELAGVKGLVAGETDEVQVNSLTIRLLIWQLGLESALDRPWIGHGAGYSRELIATSDLPESIRAEIGHLHNSYLELWVAYGLAGALVFAGVLIALARRGLHAWRAGWMPSDLAVFGLSWLAFFATINLFESYVSYRSGQLLLLVVGGIVYGLALPGRRAETGCDRK